MKYPKIKHALLCRFIPYILFFAVWLVPCAVFVNIGGIHDLIKIAFFLIASIGALIFLFSNLATLMTMDLLLAMLHCYNSARTQFELPKSFSVNKVEKRLAHFGKGYEPAITRYKPSTLRYKASISLNILAKSIEKVVQTYHVEYLDLQIYKDIVSSAQTNSLALKGKKKPIILDKEQRTSQINRAIVVIIFADTVDIRLNSELFDLVSKNNGGGFDTAFVPCVVDLSRRTCVFNSLRVPYTGIMYPAHNRAVNLIKKHLFNGNLHLKSNRHFVKQKMTDLDTEQSLWSFWRSSHKEIVKDERDTKKRFNSMAHKELILKDEILYIKLGERGTITAVELDEHNRIAKVDPLDCWTYPKSNYISKNSKAIMTDLIKSYFQNLGYTVEFVSCE